MSIRRPKLTADDYVAGVLAGDRGVLARAITLIESRSLKHRDTARDVLQRLLPHAGGSQRIGITGVPGVGKSTFIESFGMQLIDSGERLAVLAIDPTSNVTGGSILGDKTRMTLLSRRDEAFIRPSATSGSLGGVARNTRETMLLCEAAGYTVVLIETVGVGQSEIVVSDMVDFFLVLMLAGAGDELQGIKRGILEIADVIAINKADGDNKRRAEIAAKEYKMALRFMRPRSGAWNTRVTTCSAQTGDGLDALWTLTQEHRAALQGAGDWSARRSAQELRWMWSIVEDTLKQSLHEDRSVAALIPALEAAVRGGKMPASTAAAQLLDAFRWPGS